MNSKDIKIKANELNLLLTQKLDFMNHIYEITEQQKKDLTEKDGEKINLLLDLRQKEMDSVDEIDKKFLSVFSALKELLGVNDLSAISVTDYPEVGAMKEKITLINDLANKTLVLEKENKVIMGEQMDAVRKEISMLRKGKQGLKAYENKPQSNDSYYIDKKK